MNRYDVYQRWRRSIEARQLLCTLTFEQWCTLWDESGCYELRDRNGYVMAQSVPGDGFVPGNVEIIPVTEVFRRVMDAPYGDRNYL